MPEPVGATTSACRPAAIASHAPVCAAVGSANAAPNQARVGSLNCCTASSCRRPPTVGGACSGSPGVNCASVDVVTEPERQGLLGRAAGALTGKVVETIPPDVILEHIDIDALLDRIDINRVLDRIDMDRLLARIDMEPLLRNVDVETLVRRSGVPDLVAESTRRLAGGALDVARRQVVGLDTILIGVIATVLRRPPEDAPTRPAGTSAPEEEQDVQTVSGQYAGPLGRLLAFGIDAGLMFALFTMGTAGLDYLLRVFFDTSIGGRGDTPWSLVAAIAWAFVYVVVTTTIAGRTPGKGIVGLRVVTAAGYTVTPGQGAAANDHDPGRGDTAVPGAAPDPAEPHPAWPAGRGRRYSGRLRLGRPSGQDAGPSVHIRGQSDRAGADHPLGDASGSAGARFQ